MSNNTSCSDCNNDLGLPIGLTGAAGDPGFHSMSYTIAGSPVTNSTTSYVEAGRFVFSNTFADPFTALKTNVWVNGGTGSMRVIDLITSTVIYENTAITSTSSTNIETVTGISVYSATNAVIAVQIKASSGQTASIGSSTFYFS